MSLTAGINRAILSQMPRGWRRHLTNYANCDMVLPEVFEGQQEEQQNTDSVFLKLLNNSEEQYYCVRPGQLLGEEKFREERYSDCLLNQLIIVRHYFSDRLGTKRPTAP